MTVAKKCNHCAEWLKDKVSDNMKSNIYCALSDPEGM